MLVQVYHQPGRKQCSQLVLPALAKVERPQCALAKADQSTCVLKRALYVVARCAYALLSAALTVGQYRWQLAQARRLVILESVADRVPVLGEAMCKFGAGSRRSRRVVL